ncbi:hypothetical protein F2P79_012196 [Pimephales promelas]|nr:hypothetical protein F2P79_012196 [Pimephales promelas]
MNQLSYKASSYSLKSDFLTVMAPALPSISHLHGNSPATGFPLMANESVMSPGFSSNGGGPGKLKCAPVSF